MTPLTTPDTEPLSDTTPRRRSVSLRRPFATGLLLAGGALAAFTAWSSIPLLLPLLASIALAAIFAIGLAPAVRALQRRRVPRGLAIGAVTGSTLLVIVGSVLLLVPTLTQQATQLLARTDEFLTSGSLDSLAVGLQRFVPDTVLDVNVMLDEAVHALLETVTAATVYSDALSLVTSLGTGLLMTALVIILTVYFLASGTWFRRQFLALLPAAHRRAGIRVTDRITRSVGQYLRALILLALLNGALTLIILLITGATLPVLLAAVALVCTLIPLIGIQLGAVIVVAVQALTAPTDTTTWVTLTVWYFIYALVEAYVIAPRVIGHRVNMPQIVVLLLTLIGGALYGILGALLSIPIAIAIAASAQELAKTRRQSAARA
ncbi:AI-2E family transporter [Leucobacter weissii]|uniref:AI-2E family transporter n=1 Tax=Leucobacter weissii TaxID=1983706 RepID=A0A939MPD1_9MICO|nr:AI-2E family transporter [Leucobacter weissii]MBO1902492.1 AI-2E family transporter [Leucobacter weissii]